jgi:hypothetical protein
VAEGERLRRWRLLLGSCAAPALGLGTLTGEDAAIDDALGALYDDGGESGRLATGGAGGGAGGQAAARTGALGRSAPRVARWLGDIRQYFPSTVVQVMQRDAIDRLDLRQLLFEKEMLETVQPDVHLVGSLLSLRSLMPETTKATARVVVAKVVAEIERRIADRTRSAVTGALNRAARVRRPRHRDIDWNRTIAANLARYVPTHRTVIPERLIGYGRRQHVAARDIVLAIDQSGSMASSVVYASVFGTVLASLRSLRTSVVAFDTSVADLSALLTDPVDVLFGTQLGGGTDINQAIAYCETLVCARCTPRASASSRCSRSLTTAPPPTTRATPPTWPPRGSRPSPAPLTPSPTCSRSRSRAVTSRRGRTGRTWPDGDGPWRRAAPRRAGISGILVPC